MSLALTRTDALLRGTGPFAADAEPRCPLWWAPVMILCFAPIYGAMMGSYHFDSPDRLWQVLYSGIKVPLLLWATGLVCLPGFFILNTVLGLRDDFGQSLQAILAGQAGLSVALASLAPLTRLWYFSTTSYRGALLFNAGLFAAATLAGHIIMLRYYRPLIHRRTCHRIALYVWLALYAFVGIQMGWMLRPFVGSPNMPVSFVRDEPFSNAYVVVARLIWS